MQERDDIVQSPCIMHCCLDDDDICLGCFRSLEEVQVWAETDNIGKQMILNDALNRRKSYLEKIQAKGR